jgi:hypothetical protein
MAPKHTCSPSERPSRRCVTAHRPLCATLTTDEILNEIRRLRRRIVCSYPDGGGVVIVPGHMAVNSYKLASQAPPPPTRNRPICRLPTIDKPPLFALN